MSNPRLFAVYIVRKKNLDKVATLKKSIETYYMAIYAGTRSHDVRTDEIGDVVAVAEPSGGLAGARQVDAVVGLVGPGDAFAGKSMP